jgi:hypothetical protein
VGVIGSLLLHTLLLTPLLLGSNIVKVPLKQGAGASAVPEERAAESPLILLQIANSESSDAAILQELSSKGVAPKDLPLILISDDPTPVFAQVQNLTDDAQVDANVANGDPAAHAKLFGMYTGQLQARIERLWRRPQTPVEGVDHRRASEMDDQAFRCQANIRQDAHGEILEILLPNCNGTPAWQRSLVVAIQSAAPLPAPPSPTVFSASITLNFVGYAYSPGASADEYEIIYHDIVSRNQ